jgi:hypothetical protein
MYNGAQAAPRSVFVGLLECLARLLQLLIHEDQVLGARVLARVLAQQVHQVLDLHLVLLVQLHRFDRLKTKMADACDIKDYIEALNVIGHHYLLTIF